MSQRPESKLHNPLRTARNRNVAAKARMRRHGGPSGKRARDARPIDGLPYAPPEDWHEPREDQRGYRVIMQPAGPGFRHILTPRDVRARLAELPAHFLKSLEVVQLSQLTRKKQTFPCYGMQWGASIYLYPLEESLVEYFDRPPRPNLMNEVRMYGGRWETGVAGAWKLIWSEAAIRDFYLNNILIHELGHLVDDRNTSYGAREQYAEWFAIHHGYLASRPRAETPSRQVVRRHHRV